MWHELNRFGIIKLLIPLAILATMVILSACAGGAAPPTPAAQATVVTKEVTGGNPQQGVAAIQKYGCGACHIIPGVQGANGTVAPSLAGFSQRQQIAGVVPNTPENLVRWIQNPQAVKADTAMPSLGVTEPDARNIAAYLYTLK